MHSFVARCLPIGRALTTAIVAAALAVAPYGCSKEPELDDPAEVASVGQLELALTAVSQSGTVYRLRDGVFTISSLSTGEQVDVSTEDDPDRTSIDLELPAGSYAVFLNSGYYLEVVSGGYEEDGGTVGLPPPTPGPTPVPGVAQAKGRGFTSIGEPVETFDAGGDDAYDGGFPDPGEEEDGGTGGTILLSDNPQLVSISADSITHVSFRFRVSGDDVEFGNGYLSIGIEVEDDFGSACEADEYEPNDDFLEAAPISVDDTVSASACPGNDDFYTFDSPVAEGESFIVQVSFIHDMGDVDAVLFDQYGYDVAWGFSVTDDEILFATSDGGPYTLLVYTFDYANTYSVSIETDVDDLVSNCCETSVIPGCSQPEVVDCVCEMDSFCCEVEFDSICVGEAVQCGADCGTNEGSCCDTADEGGCGDEEVEDCICAVDSQCCLSGYDQLCIDQAVAACGLQCELPPPESDCCEASDVGQCTDQEVSDCVGEFDAYCRNVAYDENCVAMGITYCNANCEEGE